MTDQPQPDKVKKFFRTKADWHILKRRTEERPDIDKFIYRPYFTYQDLYDFLATLTPEQLAQQVQLLEPSGNLSEPVRLDVVIAASTVAELCHMDNEVVLETRNALDFTHRPEQVVLLQDDCPFGKHGDTLYTLEKDGGMRGNRTGKLYKLSSEDPVEGD